MPADELTLPTAGIAASATRGAGLLRLLVVGLLGFASGLPLALVGQALQAWMATEGLDVAGAGLVPPSACV